MNHNSIIQQIKNGDESALLYLYQTYRNTFINSALRKYHCSIEEAKDVFQDVLYIFHQNIMSGQLTELTVKAEYYLWRIGSHRLSNSRQRRKMGIKIIESLSLKNKQSCNQRLPNESKQFKLLQQLIERLPSNDQKLLNLCFYQNFCMEAVARELGYQNSQVARNRKRKVLKRLIEDTKKIQQMAKVYIIICLSFMNYNPNPILFVRHGSTRT